MAGLLFFGLASAAQTPTQPAQGPVEPALSFELASVRRSRANEDTYFHVEPNGITFGNYLTVYIIVFAYGQDLGEFGFIPHPRTRLVGGTGWVHGGDLY